MNLNYNALAQIYDDVMTHVDYDAWADYILNLLDYAGCEVKTICDISAGTGEMAIRLARKPFHIFVADISVPMLKNFRHKKNAEQFPILVNDACDSAFKENTMDSVLMLYDSINYILAAEDLNRMFGEIHRILQSGGLFIFDTVTENHCKIHFNREIEEIFWEDRGYRRSSYFNDQEKRQYTNFDIYIGDRIFHEQHIQSIYSITDLKNCLTRVGFDICGVFAEFTQNEITDKSARIHMVCRKE